MGLEQRQLSEQKKSAARLATGIYVSGNVALQLSQESRGWDVTMYVCLSHSARRERLPRLETTQGWLEWTMGSVAPGRIRLEQ